MKVKTQLLLLSSVLILGVQGVAYSASAASPFPAAASEESYYLPAIESYAERHARMGGESEAWGVSKRERVEAHNPFPFGGGPVDD